MKLVALIECKLQPGGFTVPGDELRLYEIHEQENGKGFVRRQKFGCPDSSWQHITDETVIEDGEEIRQYVMTESGGYISHFLDWDDVINFVTVLMRAEILSISREL